MANNLMDLMQQAGDDHIGQTLTRLAHLAVTAHWFEQAAQAAAGGPILKLVGQHDLSEEGTTPGESAPGNNNDPLAFTREAKA